MSCHGAGVDDTSAMTFFFHHTCCSNSNDVDTHKVNIHNLTEMFNMRHIMFAVPFFNIRNKGAADTGIVMYDINMTEIIVNIFKHFGNGFLIGEVAAICKCLYPIFFA